jgi:hypothetical protein
MRLLLIALVLCLLNSCVSNEKLLKNLPGIYYASSKDEIHEIVIREDSSFIYDRHLLEIHSRCIGTWKYVGGDSIRITCDEAADPWQKLANGYIGGYTQRVLIANTAKIKMNGVTLRRK